MNEKETKVHENFLVDYQGILFVNVTKIQKKLICSLEILKVIKIVFMFLFILFLSVRPYVSRNFEIGTNIAVINIAFLFCRGESVRELLLCAVVLTLK